MTLPQRKPNRLKNYDYSCGGAYFVTICTDKRKALLSRITVGEGVSALPQNKLTAIGKEVENSIAYINRNNRYVRIEKYVIMPNHIHLIVRLDASGGHGGPPLQRIVGQLKSYTTHKFGNILWQRSYHDHIIRDESDYRKIWQYIDTNPLKWTLDRYYVP